MIIVRLVCVFVALRAAAAASSSPLPVPAFAGHEEAAEGSVLVLGSGGVVGTGLVAALVKAGFYVEVVRNRRHVDLRVPGALARFDDRDIRFVFFLACEVVRPLPFLLFSPTI